MKWSTLNSNPKDIRIAPSKGGWANLANLKDLIEKINSLDNRILNLINRRAKLALKIGEEGPRKIKTGQFYVPHSEQEVIDR